MQNSQIALMEKEYSLGLHYSRKYKAQKLGEKTYKLVSTSEDEYKIKFLVVKNEFKKDFTPKDSSDGEELLISVEHIDHLPYSVYSSRKTLQEYKQSCSIFSLYQSLEQLLSAIDKLILSNSFDLELKDETVYFKVNFNSDFFKGSILFDMDLEQKEFEQNSNDLVNQVNNLKLENKKLKNEFNSLEVEIEKLNKLKLSDSIVLEEEKQQVAKWIAPNKKVSFELLYKASSFQGDSAASFHYYCNNKGPTVTFITTTKGNRFGAFTSQSWTNSQNYKSDSNAFIFSLDFNEKYPSKEGINAIFDYSGYGPTFGSGHNIHIADECLSNRKSFSNSSDNYNDTGNLKRLTGGQYYFGVEDYEVYQVIGL